MIETPSPNASLMVSVMTDMLLVEQILERLRSHSPHSTALRLTQSTLVCARVCGCTYKLKKTAETTARQAAMLAVASDDAAFCEFVFEFVLLLLFDDDLSFETAPVPIELDAPACTVPAPVESVLPGCVIRSQHKKKSLVSP